MRSYRVSRMSKAVVLAITFKRPAKFNLAGYWQKSTAELGRQCGLDRLPEQRRLVCHWHRDGEGRLAGVWEADIGLVPQL